MHVVEEESKNKAHLLLKTSAKVCMLNIAKPREIKPVNPKEINPEYSFEGLMLKLQYFGHLMQRADSLEKTLMLGKIEGSRRRG